MLIQEIANAYDEVWEKVRGKRLTGLRRALQTACLLLNGGKLASCLAGSLQRYNMWFPPSDTPLLNRGEPASC